MPKKVVQAGARRLRPGPLDRGELVRQLLAAWARNDAILRLLLDHVPPKGLRAVPAGSKGRDVAAQFWHLHRVRLVWVGYHETGQRRDVARYDKAHRPTKAQLRRALVTSGRAVADFLSRAFDGEARLRLFKGEAVRWLAYLIAHESHHRGQILLALKQSGMRMDDRLAVDGIWGRWVYGA